MIRAAANFNIQTDLPTGEPRAGIQQLSFDSGNLSLLLGGPGDLHIQCAGAKLIDDRAMLLGNAMLEFFRGEIGGHNPLFVSRRAPMDDAAAVIDGGVNEGMQGAAVLGLNVEDLSAHLNIGVES